MDEEKISVLYIDDEPNNLNVFKANFRFDFGYLEEMLLRLGRGDRARRRLSSLPTLPQSALPPWVRRHLPFQPLPHLLLSAHLLPICFCLYQRNVIEGIQNLFDPSTMFYKRRSGKS